MLLAGWLVLMGVFPTLAQAATDASELPRLVLPDLQDRNRHLLEWCGKVILLNFWATWCGPCQIELPHLVEYQRRYGRHGLQVIGVGLDRPDKLENVVRTLDIPYPVLHISSRQGGRLLRQWGNSQGVLPYTVVIDRSGSIVFTHIGVFDDEAFEFFVKPLLSTGLE